MKKKIFFIYPPSPIINREDRCQQPVKELFIIPPLPPMDLLYLAGVAELQNYEAKISDYSIGGDFMSDLEKYQPDYLVVNVAIPTLETDFKAIELAKKRFPKMVTIAKGAPFLTKNKEYLYDNRYIDIIIVGEAEETLKEILEGKENQILLDMKTCLYDVLTEKEKLFKENCDLISEIAELREQLLKHK